MALVYYPHQETTVQDLEIATRIGELFHNKTSMRYYTGHDFQHYGSQLLETWIFPLNTSTLVINLVFQLNLLKISFVLLPFSHFTAPIRSMGMAHIMILEIILQLC